MGHMLLRLGDDTEAIKAYDAVLASPERVLPEGARKAVTVKRAEARSNLDRKARWAKGQEAPTLATETPEATEDSQGKPKVLKMPSVKSMGGALSPGAIGSKIGAVGLRRTPDQKSSGL